MDAAGIAFAIVGGLMAAYGVFVTPTSAMHQIYQATLVAGGLSVSALGCMLTVLATRLTVPRKPGKQHAKAGSSLPDPIREPVL